MAVVMPFDTRSAIIVMQIQKNYITALFLFFIMLFFSISLIASSGKEYIVQRGDTIFSISRKFGVPVADITRENKITNPNTLFAGQKLVIPEKSDSNIPRGMSFQWPVRDVRHVRPDGNADVPTLGVFITVPNGAYISASAGGTVSKIGYVRGYGNYVVITHPGRVMTVYSNLDYIIVSEGEAVSPGKQIARLSPTKNSFHFQINNSGKPLDALKYLPRR